MVLAEKAPRSKEAIMENPSGVNVVGVKDPTVHGQRIMKIAAMRVVQAKLWKNLIFVASSDDYKKLLENVVEHFHGPGALVQAWADTMPHTKARSLTSVAEKAPRLLAYAPAKLVSRARLDMIKDQKASLLYGRKIARAAKLVTTPFVVLGPNCYSS